MHYKREDGCRAWLTYGQFRADSLQAILGRFGTAEAVYDQFLLDGGACLKEWLSPQQKELLQKQAVPDAMHDMMVTMHREQIGIVAMDDYGFPDTLRDLSDPPPLLFYRGDLDCLMRRCVTMVGSRSPSPNALEAARTIARDLSAHGVSIVSGLAHGIDTAAHTGCLEGGSPTVAVMGCGLDIEYPARNHDLKEQIVRTGGVILSEYPPGCPALSWHFPVRNRILSGLSKAVVLVEAKIRSGSMTTIHHALNQGKEVFAYPGNIGSEWAEGTHQLLREGANYFTSAADILEDLDWQASCPALAEQEKAAVPPLTEEQRMVYHQLSQGEQSFDQLSQATGLDTPALSGALTMLQIMGLIIPLPGKTYCKASS